MVRKQFAQGLVEAGDETVGYCDPDQDRKHTLGHRPDVQLVVLGEAMPIVRDLGLAVDIDQDGPNVVQPRRSGTDRGLDLRLQGHVIDRRFTGRSRGRGRCRGSTGHRRGQQQDREQQLCWVPEVHPVSPTEHGNYDLELNSTVRPPLNPVWTENTTWASVMLTRARRGRRPG
jgi:hypothetical protein